MLHLNLEDSDVISSGHFRARPFRLYRRYCMMFKGWPVWNQLFLITRKTWLLMAQICQTNTPSTHTHIIVIKFDLARWQVRLSLARRQLTSLAENLFSLSVLHFWWLFNVNQVNPSSFVSLVLLAWYVECIVVVHNAFKPNKGPWIFNQGAAVWLSALQTVVTYQYICHLIYPPSRIIEIYWHLDNFNYLPFGH